MILRSLAVRDFRNVAAARLELSGRRQFLLGANAQGKTNLLEAAGCLTALRSFRTSDSTAMIRRGAAEAAVASELEHERRGPTRLMVVFRPDGKELWWDAERVRRLADHLGQFPVVAFSSQDLQLLRGAPAGRRRWLDLTLAAMDGAYLRTLLAYGKGLAERNRLLKSPTPSVGQLSAFEEVMALAAADLVSRRRASLAELGAAFREAYSRLAGAGKPDGRGEDAGLGFAGSGAAGDAHSWRELWAAARGNDLRLRTTSLGPHRDDLEFRVGGVTVKEYASEGQQRSVVLALRLAQAAWFHGRSGVRPVILADDVLGELDPARRMRFWAALDPEAQVLATGTSRPGPELGAWQVFTVNDGTFAPTE